MNIDLDTAQDRTTLVMEGDMTIRQAQSAKEELQNALKKAQHIELDVTTVTEVDLAFLQLLCSAHHTSITMGKTLELKGKPAAGFTKAIADNGYARLHGCAFDSNNTCLWLIK